MNSKLGIFALIISLALAAVLIAQRRAATRLQQVAEKLQLQIEESDKTQKMAVARVKELEQEVLKLRGETQAAELELNQVRQTTQSASPTAILAGHSKGAVRPASSDSSKEEGDGPGNFLAKMMKDPEMRKAMEQQQRMAMDMVYGSLVKKLQLNPEQEKQFKELLLGQQMASMSQAGTMLDQSATNRTEIAQQLDEDRQQREEQMKALLGDEKFEQYQDYNQTLGERMMLDQFGKQAEISQDQTEQLLAIMREEKQNVQLNHATEPFDASKDWQKLIESGEVADRLFVQQEEVNVRVLSRASQVLSPEQLQKFGPILKNQVEMQKAGMKMTRQMLGSGSQQPNPGPPPTPAPVSP